MRRRRRKIFLHFWEKKIWQDFLKWCKIIWQDFYTPNLLTPNYLAAKFFPPVHVSQFKKGGNGAHTLKRGQASTTFRHMTLFDDDTWWCECTERGAKAYIIIPCNVGRR